MMIFFLNNSLTLSCIPIFVETHVNPIWKPYSNIGIDEIEHHVYFYLDAFLTLLLATMSTIDTSLV